MAGILTEVNHRISKMGKPFGTFTIEDYTGSHQVSVFGEDYMKVKDFLAQESFVYMKARIQARYNAPDQLELRPSSMSYLSDLSDKMAKTFTLKLSASMVSEAFIEEVTKTLSGSPGPCMVKVQISDPVENISVELPSRKMRVKVSRKLVEDLEAIGVADFKLNS